LRGPPGSHAAAARRSLRRRTDGACCRGRNRCGIHRRMVAEHGI